MKVSTSYFYDRSTLGITEAQGRLATVQAKLASGKQLVAPSEDPDRALAIERLNRAQAGEEALADRLDMVRARLEAEEAALSSVSQILLRFKELSVRGVDDSLNPQNRQAIAAEMRALREQLITVANDRDDKGNYLFGGSSVGSPPYLTTPEGKVVYQGDQTISWFTEGAQNIVEFNRSGTHVFTRVLRGTGDEAQGVAFFDALDQLIVAVRDSDKAGMQRGLGETDALIDANALALVRVGADGKALDNQRDMIDESLVRLKSLRSEIEDLDYAEAVTRMNQEMLALQAAMTSFGRISQLNLFSVVDL